MNSSSINKILIFFNTQLLLSTRALIHGLGVVEHCVTDYRISPSPGLHCDREGR